MDTEKRSYYINLASNFFFEGHYSQKIKTLKNLKKNKENKISHGRGNSLSMVTPVFSFSLCILKEVLSSLFGIIV